MTCPSIKQALDLFDEGLAAMRKEQQRFAFYYEKSFRSHCCLVACCAEMIASRIDSIDGQKAYILGLLHDYGKMVRMFVPTCLTGLFPEAKSLFF